MESIRILQINLNMMCFEHAKLNFCTSNAMFIKTCYNKHVLKSLEQKRLLMYLILTDEIHFLNISKTDVEPEFTKYNLSIDLYDVMQHTCCCSFELAKLDQEIKDLSSKNETDFLKKKKYLISLILDNKINVIKISDEEIQNQLEQYNIPMYIYDNLKIYECTPRYLKKLTNTINNY